MALSNVSPSPAPSTRWCRLKARLDAGEVILMDGGTGTEVERLVKAQGGETAKLATNDKGWSCAQALLHPGVCKHVHESYLEAGAQVVIANTYASNRVVLEPAGYASEVARINLRGVEVAKEARQNAFVKGVMRGRPLDAVVVGSMSCHPPEMDHGSEDDRGVWPADEVVRAAFLEQATLLRDAGADAIFVELIWDLKYGSACLEAALSVGVPVFAGLSCAAWGEDDDQKRPAMLRDFKTLVSDAVAVMSQLPGAHENLAGFNVHHTKVYATGHALKAVRAGGWHGLLGAYPDHGKFEFPHWQFHELSNEKLVSYASEWIRDSGVQLIGGCCGIGPSHISALGALCKQ